MRKWFIEITCKTDDDFKITIYNDGSVYGIERGKKLVTLNSNAMAELEFIINESLGEFRKLGYHNYHNNPLVLKINDINKNKIHKIVGWPPVSDIMKILLNKSNFTPFRFHFLVYKMIIH